MVYNNIKKYRKKFNVSQQELGYKLGVTKQYISKLEKCSPIPGLEFAFLIVKAFKDITMEKSEGKQVIDLKLEDIFYTEL